MLDLPPDLCQDAPPVCHLSPCILLIISCHIQPSGPECICNIYRVLGGGGGFGWMLRACC